MTEIAAGGHSLVYSTYLGGNGVDCGTGIALDGAGNAYVTGYTLSADFPTLNAIQAGYAGGTNYGDAFVTEIAAGGQSLFYSTYLGGSGDDAAYGIAVDGPGNAYVTGGASTDFPLVNAFQSTSGLNGEAFLAEITDLWQNAIYTGNGWYYLSPFGAFTTSSSSWIYHLTLGWLYPDATSTNSIWFYDPQWNGQGGWWWTSSSFFPWIFSITENEWLYFDAKDSTAAGSRWFFNGAGVPSTH